MPVPTEQDVNTEFPCDATCVSESTANDCPSIDALATLINFGKALTVCFLGEGKPTRETLDGSSPWVVATNKLATGSLGSG